MKIKAHTVLTLLCAVLCFCQDFTSDGSKVLSAGMDHSVKMWDIATEEVQDVVDASAHHTHSEKRYVCGSSKWWRLLLCSCCQTNAPKKHNTCIPSLSSPFSPSPFPSPSSSHRNFPTLRVHFPLLSSREIHTNYADCIRSVGSLVLSKACENKISVWKPVARTVHNVSCA